MALRNIGLKEFKELAGFSNADILRNPKTQKLFLSASNGKNYKVQQDIDLKGDLVFLVDSDDIDSACLINKGRAIEALATI